MEPLTSPATLRALGYLTMVNDNGAKPLPDQLDTYALAHFPRSAHDKFYGDEPRTSFVDHLVARDYEDDSITSYLLAIGMAEDEGDGLQVTNLGRAFHAGAMDESVSTTPEGRVLK